MARYKKKLTVVEAVQAGCTDDFGWLGNLNCTDWIVVGADGGMATHDNTNFDSLFEQTNDNATLTGIDYS